MVCKTNSSRFGQFELFGVLVDGNEEEENHNDRYINVTHYTSWIQGNCQY